MPLVSVSFSVVSKETLFHFNSKLTWWINLARGDKWNTNTTTKVQRLMVLFVSLVQFVASPLPLVFAELAGVLWIERDGARKHRVVVHHVSPPKTLGLRASSWKRTCPNDSVALVACLCSLKGALQPSCHACLIFSYACLLCACNGMFVAGILRADHPKSCHGSLILK